jgi:hypothetical protein
MGTCLEIVRAGSSHDIQCIELAKSPPRIETDEHVVEVIREATDKPVTGIAESAYLAALGLGSCFGIVLLGPSSIARHLRYLVKLKLDGWRATGPST